MWNSLESTQENGCTRASPWPYTEAHLDASGLHPDHCLVPCDLLSAVLVLRSGTRDDRDKGVQVDVDSSSNPFT